MDENAANGAPADDRSLSARAYEQIRAKIIRGELPPGARLRERDLAAELNVSRIPVREALPQLEADGFIRTLPRRGAVVTTLTVDDIEQLFDARLCVEVFATRRAAQRISTGTSGDGLREALVHAEVAMRSQDPDRMADANARFHEEVLKLAGNALLSSMMRSVDARIRWLFRMTSYNEPEHALHEHRDLCAAILDGNVEFAAALAYAHIEGSRQPSILAISRVLPAPGDQNRAAPI